MTKRLALLAGLSVLLACAAWALGRKPPATEPEPAPAAPQEPPMTPTQTEWNGQHGGYSAPKELLIADEDAWRRLWKEGLGREAPAVDFSRWFAAAVFAGAQPTGGFSVEIQAPVESGGRLVVAYRIRRPERGAFVIQAFTQPYSVRLFEGDGRKAELRETR